MGLGGVDLFLLIRGSLSGLGVVPSPRFPCFGLGKVLHVYVTGVPQPESSTERLRCLNLSSCAALISLLAPIPCMPSLLDSLLPSADVAFLAARSSQLWQ